MEKATIKSKDLLLNYYGYSTHIIDLISPMIP